MNIEKTMISFCAGENQEVVQQEERLPISRTEAPVVLVVCAASDVDDNQVEEDQREEGVWGPLDVAAADVEMGLPLPSSTTALCEELRITKDQQIYLRNFMVEVYDGALQLQVSDGESFVSYSAQHSQELAKACAESIALRLPGVRRSMVSITLPLFSAADAMVSITMPVVSAGVNADSKTLPPEQGRRMFEVRYNIRRPCKVGHERPSDKITEHTLQDHLASDLNAALKKAKRREFQILFVVVDGVKARAPIHMSEVDKHDYLEYLERRKQSLTKREQAKLEAFKIKVVEGSLEIHVSDTSRFSSWCADHPSSCTKQFADSIAGRLPGVHSSMVKITLPVGSATANAQRKFEVRYRIRLPVKLRDWQLKHSHIERALQEHLVFDLRGLDVSGVIVDKVKAQAPIDPSMTEKQEYLEHLEREHEKWVSCIHEQSMYVGVICMIGLCGFWAPLLCFLAAENVKQQCSNSKAETLAFWLQLYGVVPFCTFIVIQGIVVLFSMCSRWCGKRALSLHVISNLVGLGITIYLLVLETDVHLGCKDADKGLDPGTMTIFFCIGSMILFAVGVVAIPVMVANIDDD